MTITNQNTLTTLKIKHIRSHPSHPQTNGKVERSFEEVERQIGNKFESIKGVRNMAKQNQTTQRTGLQETNQGFIQSVTPRENLLDSSGVVLQ